MKKTNQFGLKEMSLPSKRLHTISVYKAAMHKDLTMHQ